MFAPALFLSGKFAYVDLEFGLTPQAGINSQAYRDFGKGSGHRAQLNFGDCFAYSLAVESGEPLLFVGEDFSHTDVERA